MALLGLHGMSLLIARGVEAERLVLMIRLGQLLLAALELLEVLPLLLRPYQEGRGSQHA